MASDGGGGFGDGETWRSRVGFVPDAEPTAAPSQLQLQMRGSSPLVDPDRSSYGTGAGGKSRPARRSERKTTVPYERPAVGRHAAAGPQAAVVINNGGVTAAQDLAKRRGGWLKSGISKIITSSATYLYTSIFKRHLPAPLQVANIEAQPVDGEEQGVSPSADAQDHPNKVNLSGSFDEEHNEVREADASSLSELERLLQRKTLSRGEFDRLSALLQSRVVSNGVEQLNQSDIDGRVSRGGDLPMSGAQFESQRLRQDLQKSRDERENGVQTMHVPENGTPSGVTPATAPESLDGLASSPVEVAIAFMGGRVWQPGSRSPGEPLNQRDENLLFFTPPPPPGHVQGPPQISQGSLSKWVPSDSGNEEQFFTPPPPSGNIRRRNQGLPRTPYSRPVQAQTPREKVLDGTFGTPYSSRWTPIRTPVTGGREMLKRRSTVLDESWASVGPIRRTRQKAIASPAPSSLRGPPYQVRSTSGSTLRALPSPYMSKFSEAAASQWNASPNVRQEKDVLTLSGSSYVPAQSSETARKILETLEKMTPSPKGKSLEEELSYLRNRLPTTLTESMLNDQARKSMTVVEYSLPSGDSREPGPSGRNVENESSNFSQPGVGPKTLDHNSRAKAKGKSPVSPSENGPGRVHIVQEQTSGTARLLDEVSNRSKETAAVLASENEKGKGFRMSAVFEESGSDDEGRLSTVGRDPSLLKASTPTFPSFSAKIPSTNAKSLTNEAPVFGTATLSSSTTVVTSVSTDPPSVAAVEPPKVSSSSFLAASFTFPTRVSLEGPPTPKAMSPASTSPKAMATPPFFQFAANAQGAAALAPSGSTTEQNSATVIADVLPQSKPGFSFGSPSIGTTTSPQPFAKPQPAAESKAPYTFMQSAPLFGAASQPTLASALSAPTSAGAATSAMEGLPTSTGGSLKSESSATILSAPAQPKEGATSTPFAPPQSSLFGTGSGGIASAQSGVVSQSNLFGSSGTSVSFSAGNTGFGQSGSFLSRKPSVALGSATASGTEPDESKVNSTVSPDGERPQKRSASAFDQDISNRQQSVTTIPSHSFSTFGTNVTSSGATPGIPATFGAPSSSEAASKSFFTVPSYGLPSRDLPQTTSASLSATSSPSPSPSPFVFGSPVSTTTPEPAPSSAPAFGSTPSFPSFTSSVFGSASTGSTFGVASASPMTFGGASSTPAFGSTTAKPAFGGISSEAVSQSPSTTVFGSGFSAPSPSTTPPFPFGGGSSPASFSFAASAASSSSGAAFPFGSSAMFPFAGNKTVPASPQPSLFGLSGSGPAFGSTTNGTMAGDVVVSDLSNMEDSMAEEPSQVAATLPSQPPAFGGQSAAGPGSFVFGAQTGASAVASPAMAMFGFPPQSSAGGFGAANPFSAPQPGGSLDFAGGAFNLGSGGDNKPNRKFIKAKRTGAKRGK